MNDKIARYLNSAPEIVFEWNDSKSEARGWLVINSLKGGAAGGGTRMRKGLTRAEVTDLAKTMEIKFSVCGPSIGGAKSGIDFDPSDPRKEEVLKRWYTAIRPLLKTYYGTAGDLNVDEKKEVSPILQKLGILHAQEGVLEGHFAYPQDLKKDILNSLIKGCELLVNSTEYSPAPGTNLYTTIDLITGYGVAESVRTFYQIFKNQQIHDKRIFIQGWGNVGAAAGWFLAKWGAKLVIIQDKDGYILDSNGFSLERVKAFINEKQNNTINDTQKILGSLSIDVLKNNPIDVFIPAAASKIVSKEFIEILLNNSLDLISCGANVPFDEESIFYGDLSRHIDQRISLIPDFIANCGVARIFSYLMENSGPVDENAIFNDISHTMFNALQKIYKVSNDSKNIAKRAWENAIQE
jgi:glutamate dehydrogenase/leucine dehydrogenase